MRLLNATLLVRRAAVHPVTALLGEHRRAVSLVADPEPIQLAEFNVTLPEARFLNVTVALNASIEGGYVSVYAKPCTIEIGPHFILKEAKPATPAVPVGRKVPILVTYWNNYLPGEPNTVTAFLELRLANTTHSTLVFDAFNFTPGVTETKLIEVPLPKTVALGPTTPFADASATLSLGATADSFAPDNDAQFTIRILNTSSWVTWILLGAAAVMILAVAAILAGARASRSAAALAARSPFLEE
ncbi:MAG: hypothetical protein ACP5ID_06495 [Conexivisphaera sp.]